MLSMLHYYQQLEKTAILPSPPTTHPQVFICQESLLCAYPPVPLLRIPQEQLELVALAEQALPLLPGFVELAVFFFQTTQAGLDLGRGIVLLGYQGLQRSMNEESNLYEDGVEAKSVAM